MGQTNRQGTDKRPRHSVDIVGFGFANPIKKSIFALPNGALAEWLGAGLQNLSQWFDSATHLQQMPLRYLRGIFSFKFSYNFPTN